MFHCSKSFYCQSKLQAAFFFVASFLLLVDYSVAASASTPAECPFLTKFGLGQNEFDPISSAFSNHQPTRSLKRYEHYKSGDAAKYHGRTYEPSYSSFSDIWLCLACALGWTVWLVNVTRSQTDVSRSVFESQQSRKVHGNVLQVTLGEDADMTGIPIYHTLVDYVVESDAVDEEPLQVRKCFSTRKLLQEGFANVEVLVLEEDPTTSLLMEDFLEDQKERARQQMEPPSMMWAVGVYIVAATLIATSVLGGLHAVYRLNPNQMKRGKIALAVGTVLLYPTAVLLYNLASSAYQLAAPWAERPGVIIHGAKDYWRRKCFATLNPLEVMGTFDNDTTMSPTSGMNMKVFTPTNSGFTGTHYSNATGNLEMTSPYSPANRSPLYPNAGCGFGRFSVHMPKRRTQPIPEEECSHDKVQDLSTISASDMSSTTGGTHSASTREHANREYTISNDDYANLQIPSMVNDCTDTSDTERESTGDQLPPLTPSPMLTMNNLISPAARSMAPTPLASNVAKIQSSDAHITQV